MSKNIKDYKPTDALVSPRFCGIKTFMRLPYVTDLEDVDVAIIGVPFDTATTYRTGARLGQQLSEICLQLCALTISIWV